MTNSTKQTVVLVTGCSSGIGRLTAETAARAGYQVYASMRGSSVRNRDQALSLAGLSRKEDLRLLPVELDVTDSESVHRAVESILNEAGHIDVLVNNAGHMAIGIAEGFSEGQVQHQMNVNFLGPYRVSRAVLPHMREQRSGLLIHVSSILGRVLFPGCAFYCASKFALEALAEVFHYELTAFGIDSVVVQPGPFPTQLLDNSPGPTDADRVAAYGELATLREDFLQHFCEFFGSKETTDPQEVADAITNLIGLPAGQRPLRTVCGPDYGALAINQHAAPLQAGTLRALEMDAMADRALGKQIGVTA